MKLYSCSAGASTGGAAWGCSSSVFARTFASRMYHHHYYWNATIYGYTKTVTSPSREGTEVHRWALDDRNAILGQASAYRQRFDGY